MYKTCLALLTVVCCDAQIRNLDILDLPFEPNHGQFDQEYQFAARAADSFIMVKNDGLCMTSGRGTKMLRLVWKGSTGVSRWDVGERLAGVSHYYNVPKPVENVPHYREVRGISVYPGIDLRLHGNGRSFEYDFEVAPGADARKIAWSLPEKAKLDNGDLVIAGLRLKEPEAWQEVDGHRIAVPVRYRVRGRTVGFALGHYDRSKKLTIDPVIANPGFRTFFGTTADEDPSDMAVSSSGEIYVTGKASGAFAPGFVTKLNAGGSAILYTTYLYTSDVARAIAVDANGNVAVGGMALSLLNVVQRNGFQSLPGGDFDAFITRLNPSGTLQWSSFLGGPAVDSIYGIAYGSAGQIYVSGQTGGPGFPVTTGAFQTAFPGEIWQTSKSGFVARISAAGVKEAATYVGPVVNSISNLVVDSQDNPLIAISTVSNLGLRIDHELPTPITATTVARLSPDLRTLLNNLQVSSAFQTVINGFALLDQNTVAVAALQLGSGLLVARRRFDGTGHLERSYNADPLYPTRVLLSPEGHLLVAGSNVGGGNTGSLIAYSPVDLSRVYSTSVSGGSGLSVTGLAAHGNNVFLAGSVTGSPTAEQFGISANAVKRVADGTSEGFIAQWQTRTCNALPSVTYSGSTTVPVEGATVSLQIVAEPECAWEMSVRGAFLGGFSVVDGGTKQGPNAVTGVGPGTLRIRLPGNGSSVPFTYFFEVQVTNVTIGQPAGNCTAAFGPLPGLTTGAGTAAVGVNNGASFCTWKVQFVTSTDPPTAITAPTWLSVTPGATGLQLSWTANPSALSRSVRIQVKSDYAYVTSAEAVTTITQPGAGCTVTLNKTADAIPASGGISGVPLTTSVTDCSVPTSSSAPWLVPIVRGSTVLFRVSTNQVPTPRMASLTVGGQTFTVSQAGSGGCTFTVASTALSATLDGGEQTLRVTASNPACEWFAFPRTPWMNIYPESGKGSADLRISVLPNYASAARTGTLDTGGVAVSMNQVQSNHGLSRDYLRLLYHSLFGRLPSPAELEAQGSRYFFALYPKADSLAITDVTAQAVRASFYYQFLTSEEFNQTARFAAGLYIGLLDRDPEVEGWRFQRDAIRAGIINPVSAVDAFLNSPEYKVKWGTPTNAEFIRLLYRYVLLREARDDEVTFHVGTLATLSRTQVAYNFLQTKEYFMRIGPRLQAFLLGAVLLQRDLPPQERNDLINGTFGDGAMHVQLMEDFLSIFR